MSNQNSELQKTEKKESLIQKTALDTVSKTASTVLAAGIVAVLAGLVAFLYGLPVSLYLPVGAVVFFLICSGLFLYGKFKTIPKATSIEAEYLKQLASAEENYKEQLEYKNHIHQTTLRQNQEDFDKQIESLGDKHQSEIEQLNNKYVEEIDVLKKSQQIFLKEERRHEDIMNSVAWLMELADKQRENIDHYVVLQGFHYCYIATDTVPILIMVVEIINKSLFEVEMDNSIEGFVEFDRMTLRGHTYFNDRSSRVIDSTGSKRITLQVEITNEQKEYIENFQKETKIAIERGFRVDKLKLIINGSVSIMRIIPKQLKIREGFKVINSNEYTGALEKFSQF